MSGFNGARPVRIGNAAFTQWQIDIFGEVIDMMHQVRVADLEVDEADISHMSLVDTAMNLAQARGPAKKRAEGRSRRT